MTVNEAMAHIVEDVNTEYGDALVRSYLKDRELPISNDYKVNFKIFNDEFKNFFGREIR